MSKVDRFVELHAGRLLEADERVEQAGYLPGPSALTSRADFAVLTNRRLLLIRTRAGAFGPLRENLGVEAIDRGAIRAARLLRHPALLTLELADGRELAFRAPRRGLSGQRAFLDAMARLTPAASGAPAGAGAASRRAVVTPALVGANVAVFVWMVAAGVSWFEPSVRELVRWGGNVGPLSTRGEWWRLLAATYVHGGLFHLMLNMMALWQVGPLVERLVGRGGFFVAYTLAGLAGSLASLRVHPMVVTVGASGAIFGVFGCALVVLLLERGELSRGQAMRVGRGIAVFIALNLVLGASTPGIDNAAHVGGLVGGLLCGAALARRRRFVMILLPVLGAVAVVGLYRAIPASSPVSRVAFAYERLAVGGDEIYYGDGATREDASRLGEALRTAGLFGSGGKSALLARQGAGYRVSFFVADAAAKDQAGMRRMPVTLSQHVFAGAPVVVALLDPDGKELAIVEPAVEPAAEPNGADPSYLVQVDLAAIRGSELWRSYPGLQEAASDVLTAVKDACGLDLPAELESVALRGYPAPGRRALLVVRGIPRATALRCLKAAGAAGPIRDVREDGAFTLFSLGDHEAALRWSDDRTVSVEAEETLVGWLPVARARRKHVDVGRLYEPGSDLGKVAARVDGKAAIWIVWAVEGGSDTGLLGVAITNGIAIDGELDFTDSGAARAFLEVLEKGVDTLRTDARIAAIVDRAVVQKAADRSSMHLELTRQETDEVVAEAYAYLAQACGDAGRRDAELADLDRAVTLLTAGRPAPATPDPMLLLLYERRASAHAHLRHYEQANEDYGRVIAVRPSGDLYNQRAWYGLQAGTLDAALADANKAVELAPKDYQALGTRCWVHVARGEAEDAERDCEAALAIHPASRYDRGMLAFIHHDPAGAIAAWNEQIEKVPESRVELEPWIAKAKGMAPAR